MQSSPHDGKISDMEALSMNKFATTLCLLFLLAGTAMGTTAPIGPGETLDLQRCLEIAATFHPDLRGDQARVTASKARIGQNEAALKPSVNASSSFHRADGDDNTSAGITVSRLLTDGGKTNAAIRASQFSRDGTIHSLERTGQTVAYDVKEAYYGLLQAQWNAEVAGETIDVYREQLAKARAGYEAGTVARSDVTAAEVDLGQSKLERTRARSAVNVARATLLNAMGLLDGPADFSIEDIRDHDLFSLRFDEAFKRARTERPDLKALESAIRSDEETIRHQAKGLNPELSVYGGYDWADGDTSDKDEWEAGLTLSLPLYDGGLTSARLDEARADLTATQAEYDSRLQLVALEVKTALLDIEEAWENISITELTVRQAKENLDLATGRYRVGVGSPLEVSQAAEDYSESKKDYNQALYDYKLALAGLEKAMGTSVVETEGAGEAK